jgi:hypothetical protein
MIEFSRKFSLKNGNKINKKNWQRVVAVATKPCTTVHGVPEIDRAIRETGSYYEKWHLVYEKDDGIDRFGYIFREVNHGMGISGRHPSYRRAIWSALSAPYIHVYLE